MSDPSRKKPRFRYVEAKAEWVKKPGLRPLVADGSNEEVERLERAHLVKNLRAAGLLDR